MLALAEGCLHPRAVAQIERRDKPIELYVGQ